VALERIFKSGHSRVPVVTRATNFGEEQVIGLLFVKDLILLNPEDEIPVQNIIDTFCHDLKYVDLSTSVKSVMDDFRHGRSHLAIVRRQIAKKMNGECVYENIGIVTLEDIIENILRMEIEDEFDSTVITAEDKTRKNEILRLFDYRRTRGMDGMPPQEKIVVYRHLCKEVKVFMPKHRKPQEVDLQNLLAAGSVHLVVCDKWHESKIGQSSKQNTMVEDGGYLLYLQGVQSEFFTFILDGKVEVFSGRQKFRTEVSRFTILCPELLWQTQIDFVENREFGVFVPDFTARVMQNSRILRISRETFHKCLQGKLRHYSRPQKETRDKFREISQRSILRKGDSSFTQVSNYELKSFTNYELKTESDMYLSKSFERVLGVGDNKMELETNDGNDLMESEEHLSEPGSSDCIIIEGGDTSNKSLLGKPLVSVEMSQKKRNLDL